VAQIGAAHGLRGDVRLQSFTENPLAVAQYGPLTLENGAKTLRILSLRQTPQGLIARLAGVEDRAAAQRMCGLRLYVARTQLPALQDPETYYYADLIGLAAHSDDGRNLGTVWAVRDFGAGPILEIGPNEQQTAMVPFTKHAVPVVDIGARRLVLANSQSLEGSDGAKR
jgi:16S rRNA processing protein RimM